MKPIIPTNGSYNAYQEALLLEGIKRVVGFYEKQDTNDK